MKFMTLSDILYIVNYYFTLWVFITPTLAIFYRSLSDSKSVQFSKTLLSILADLNNAVVWMVSIRPPILKFFPSSF